MSIRARLASELGRNDETPNIVLAEAICATGNTHAVVELLDLLESRKPALRSDAIKVLYEIGERQPDLIAAYWEQFLQLTRSKDNRLAWGAMTALDSVAELMAAELAGRLETITAAADSGTVITRDHAVSILIKLSSNTAAGRRAFAALLDQLSRCPLNQLPMYAERARGVAADLNRPALREMLHARLGELEKESQRKRIQRVLKQLNA